MCPIVNAELDEDENLFLNSLTRSISENKSSLLLDKIKKIGKEEQSQITAFIDAVIRGNIKIFTEVIKMEDFKTVAESIRDTDFAKFWQKEGIEKGKREDRNEVLNILNNCRDLEEAKKKLMSLGV
ncbi:MAG: hypothetical protein Ta2F_14240 [Termitinemataceae bacterium]|nr:MAG: hypothetical protein Ta2F_14240 [Termitinemataceae bacterium]